MGKYKLEYFKQPWRLKGIIHSALLKLLGVNLSYCQQVIWRAQNPECHKCLRKGECDHCPCSVTSMMIAPEGRCGGGNWAKDFAYLSKAKRKGAMLNTKEWNRYMKENNVTIAVLDRGWLKDHDINPDEYEQEIEEMEKTMRDFLSRKVQLETVKTDYKKLKEQNERIFNEISSLVKKKKDEKGINEKLKSGKVTVEEYEIDFGEYSRMKKTIPDKKENQKMISKELNKDLYTDRLDEEKKNVPQEIDLGQLPMNKKIPFEYKYNGKLRPISVSASCWCTSPKIKGKLITGKLNTGSKVKSYSRRIYLELEPDKTYYAMDSNTKKLVPANKVFKIMTTLKYTVI